LTENGKCKIPHATLFGNTAEWVAEINFDEWQYCPEQPTGQTCPNPRKAPNTLSNFTDSIKKFGTVQITDISVTDVDDNVYTLANHGSATSEIDRIIWTGKAPSRWHRTNIVTLPETRCLPAPPSPVSNPCCFPAPPT
jgi:hypothetical protein